jgi:hypothetical protein
VIRLVWSRPTGRVPYEVATVCGAENSEEACVESLVAVAVIACPALTAVVGENVNERMPSTFGNLDLIPYAEPGSCACSQRLRVRSVFAFIWVGSTLGARSVLSSKTTPRVPTESPL